MDRNGGKEDQYSTVNQSICRSHSHLHFCLRKKGGNQWKQLFMCITLVSKSFYCEVAI